MAIWIRRTVREAPLGSGDAALAPDAWVRLGSDGWLTVVVARSEMGQGISTSLPMLVAEEMDADWERVRFEFAPAHSAYYNPEMGLQATGGSTSIRGAWLPLRQAGATARAMLIAAAATELGVPAGELATEAGAVVHAGTGTRRSFGALAEAAGQLPVPDDVPLKDPASFRLIGRPTPRLDTRDKVTGRTIFGIDAGPSGALVAVVARSPVRGALVRSVDDAGARAVLGVRDVVRIPSGVAVVADGYWAASQGRAALRVEWEDTGVGEVDSEAIAAGFRALADGPGRKARQVGEASAVIAASAHRLGAEYSLPYLAHACMEPMNCTADVRDDQVTVWAPTQFQAAPRIMAGGGARGVAAAIAGVPIEQVEIITTFLGGGFGRRSEQDFVAEACEVSKLVRRPVKVTYSREDDIQHDFYRPASFHRLTAALDADGRPTAWQHRVVSPSIVARFIPDVIPDVLAHLAGPLRGGIDPSSVEGIVDLPYDTGTLDVSYTQAESPVPVGYWRSVGHSANAFAVESFIDELAAAAGVDPVAYRLDLLGGHPRHARVLQAAADAGRLGCLAPGGARARGGAARVVWQHRRPGGGGLGGAVARCGSTG